MSRSTASLFVRAAKAKQLEALRLLLDRVGHVDTPNEVGETALIAAASKGDLKIVEFLLSCGASVNAVDKSGDTPLMKSATKGWDG
jgi:ankyrin repeat protein